MKIQNITFSCCNPNTIYAKLLHNLPKDVHQTIVDFIIPKTDLTMNLHYEKMVRKKGMKDIVPKTLRIHLYDFIAGFLKCMMCKYHDFRDISLIPYLRHDILYFNHKSLKNKELRAFITNYPCEYLYLYNEILSYLNYTSEVVRLGENDRHIMYSIYYYNKDNSLDAFLKRFCNNYWSHE